MKYDFDKPTDRRGSGQVKWDVKDGELPMWVADMDFETAPLVKTAIMKVAEHGIFGYTEATDEYFEAISDFWFERHGYKFNTGDMVYVSGIVAAISSAVRKLTTPAENVVIQSPVYNIFYNSIRNSGRNILESPLIYEDGEYRMDLADLEKKLADPQTTLMILCNPHNPVGKIWDKEVLARVGELCKKYGVTVISDEIHCSITEPGRSYIPFASASDVCADVSVTCVAASKCFNLAGLQAACVIAKNPVLRHKMWRGINTDEVGEPNVFAIPANIAAYRSGDWLDELNEYIFANKRFARDYISEHMPKLHVVPSDATYLIWVDISAYSNDSLAFAEDLRAKTGLYVSDGARYGKGGESFLRINLATQRANVKDGLSRLERYIKEFENEKN